MNEFDRGESLIFTAEVRNKDTNQLFDPSSIVISLLNTKGSYSITEQVMTQSSTGIYTYDWTSSERGSYKVTYKAMDGTKVTYLKDQFKII